MDKIKVITTIGSASAVESEIRMLAVKRSESEAEQKLKLALRVSRLEHTYSFAQKLGIYPA